MLVAALQPTAEVHLGEDSGVLDLLAGEGVEEQQMTGLVVIRFSTIGTAQKDAQNTALCSLMI
jgi:hypothetical protein